MDKIILSWNMDRNIMISRAYYYLLPLEANQIVRKIFIYFNVLLCFLILQELQVHIRLLWFPNPTIWPTYEHRAGESYFTAPKSAWRNPWIHYYSRHYISCFAQCLQTFKDIDYQSIFDETLFLLLNCTYRFPMVFVSDIS